MKHRLKVWGDFACFTRPEIKTERVSYEVITPSAARGIFEAILWGPEIQWNIESIQVLNPIKWINIRRNEIASKAAEYKEIYIEEDRVQRSSLILKDAAYLIEASLKSVSGGLNIEKKFNTIFQRRALKGQCFTQPYLGCREFSSYFKLLDEKEEYRPISETRDLGLMLYDMEYGQNEVSPQFFSAVMKKGKVSVPFRNNLEIQR